MTDKSYIPARHGGLRRVPDPFSIFWRRVSHPLTNYISVILLGSFACRITFAFLFAITFASNIQADSTNVSVEQMVKMVRMTVCTHKEISASVMSMSFIYTEEANIAYALRILDKYEKTQATNFVIMTTSGPVRSRSDVEIMWKQRDKRALALIEHWKDNPEEIEDKKMLGFDLQHDDFVKRMIDDKTNLQERVKHPEKYTAYQYQPYFHRPETMIFTNSHECMPFVKSDYEGYRKRIVPIIWELNDTSSLSVLAGMATDDQSENVRNKAAEAWVALLMPGGLTNDQKLHLLDNFGVPKMKGLTNNQKAWLDNFIKSDKMHGKDGKKWAIDAAERILRKMEKATQSSPGKGVQGDSVTKKPNEIEIKNGK